MATISELLPEDDDFKSRPFFVDNSKLHISDMRPEEADLIRKVVALAHEELMTPTGTAPSLIGRVEPGMPISQTSAAWLPRLEDHLADVQNISLSPLQETKTLDFPHLAWEALKLGLAKENHLNEKLNGCLDEIEKMQENISLLLELNGELGALKEDDTELSLKVMELLQKLKERGIDLNKEGQTAEELRRKVNSHESGLRSQMQIQFTTKVQRYMQQIESLIQILQNIIRNDAKLKEKANQLPRS
jgi:hypothetical protein